MDNRHENPAIWHNRLVKVLWLPAHKVTAWSTVRRRARVDEIPRRAIRGSRCGAHTDCGVRRAGRSRRVAPERRPDAPAARHTHASGRPGPLRARLAAPFVAGAALDARAGGCGAPAARRVA